VEILRRSKSQHGYFAVNAPSIGSRINRAGVGRRRGWSHSEQPLACEGIRAPDGLRHVAVRVRCVWRTRAGEPEPGDEHTGSVGRRQIRCRSDAKREPICESCAHQLLERFEREHLPSLPSVSEPDYFERAYHQGGDEQDL